MHGLYPSSKSLQAHCTPFRFSWDRIVWFCICFNTDFSFHAEYAQLFATLIARTAKDVDVLIDSLPSEESTSALQVIRAGDAWSHWLYGYFFFLNGWFVRPEASCVPPPCRQQGELCAAWFTRLVHQRPAHWFYWCQCSCFRLTIIKRGETSDFLVRISPMIKTKTWPVCTSLTVINISDWATVNNVIRGTSVVLDLKPSSRCAATDLVNIFIPEYALPVDRPPVCDSSRTRTTKQPPVWRRWLIGAICCWRRSRVRWRTSPSRSSVPATERPARCRRGTRDVCCPLVSALPVFTSLKAPV